MTRSRVAGAIGALSLVLLMIVGLFAQRTFTPQEPLEPPVISPFAWQIAAHSSDLLAAAQSAVSGLPDCSTRECSDGLTDPIDTAAQQMELSSKRLTLDASVTPECRTAAATVHTNAEQLRWLLKHEKNAIYALPKHIDAVRPSIESVMKICIIDEDHAHDHSHR